MSNYKGHTIALIPSMEGLMWACQYVIMKANQTEIAGFPDGNTYDDRKKAEYAALAKAKSFIDESALSTKIHWGADVREALSAHVTILPLCHKATHAA